MLMKLFGTIPLPDDHAEKTDVAAAIEELQSPWRADLIEEAASAAISTPIVKTCTYMLPPISATKYS